MNRQDNLACAAAEEFIQGFVGSESRLEMERRTR